MSDQKDYFSKTRHPWSCLAFLIPFILAYELGVLYLGGREHEQLRNGADKWIREAFKAVGLPPLYLLIPSLLMIGLGIWSYRRRQDRPREMLGTLLGMMIESFAFGLVLWGISRGLAPFSSTFGMTLSDPEMKKRASLLVTYLGAGIYEELLFRLILFAGLVWFFVKAELPTGVAIGISALISALVFAAAHHFGPQGEPFLPFVFFFRLIAGVYFAMVLRFRGFGVAVGTHAFYDVAVGILK